MPTFTQDQVGGLWDCLHSLYRPGINDHDRILQAQVCGLSSADAQVAIAASNDVIAAAGGPGNVTKAMWVAYVTHALNDFEAPLPAQPTPSTNPTPTTTTTTSDLPGSAPPSAPAAGPAPTGTGTGGGVLDQLTGALSNPSTLMAVGGGGLLLLLLARKRR